MFLLFCFVFFFFKEKAGKRVLEGSGGLGDGYKRKRRKGNCWIGGGLGFTLKAQPTYHACLLLVNRLQG